MNTLLGKGMWSIHFSPQVVEMAVFWQRATGVWLLSPSQWAHAFALSVFCCLSTGAQSVQVTIVT